MDRIIDFNDLKDKARAEEIKEFDRFINSLYVSLMGGKITLGEMNTAINKYAKDNEISEKKMYELKERMFEKRGFSREVLKAKFQEVGLDPSYVDTIFTYDEKAKKAKESFYIKYGAEIERDELYICPFESEKNQMTVYFQTEKVKLLSSGKIDLEDEDLKAFLQLYKEAIKGEELQIAYFESIGEFKY